MKTLLWLDDIRDPNFIKYQGIVQYLIEEYMEEYPEDVQVVWVKSFNEFRDFISNHRPDFISFDYDLGIGYNGLDCAGWLKEYCEVNDLDLPDFYIHSTYPGVRVKFQNLLQS